MREIKTDLIVSEVARLCVEANRNLPGDVESALRKGLEKESSAVAIDILKQLLENADIARNEEMPICQDCGLAVIFVELGRDVHLDGDLYEAVNEGVRQGYEKGYLRKSVCDPFTRANTGDNTPAVVHLKLVEGDKLKITVVPKGGGSENMSKVHLLKPADGWEGIKERIIEAVKLAGPNPCPPILLGIGIGGTFERASLLAKEQLLRPTGKPSDDPDLAAKEAEVLEEINNLGFGPQGLGGKTYALAVHIAKLPCHIASLPVAINIQCHAARHKEVVL
jgi:fumarate hydratase subunit alpha